MTSPRLLMLLISQLAAAHAAAPRPVEPRIFYTAPELAAAAGYPCSTHIVRTSDGYLLTMHRLGSRNDTEPVRRRLQPVLLLHGLFGSSDAWLLAGPSSGPAFILADAGYDVWMANFRGNFYSRRHVTLSPKDRLFWMFSFQEMGELDLPAMLDVITATTASRRVRVVAHSAGCAALLVMLSSPASRRHSRTVRAAALLAPAVLPSRRSLPFPIVASQAFQKLAEERGPFELLPRTKSFQQMVYALCHPQSLFHNFCTAVFTALLRSDKQQVDDAELAFYLAHLVSGTSLFTTLHFSQVARADEFRMYDFGGEENMKRYGQSQPPIFDFSQISVPISIHYGDNDIAVKKEDAERLYMMLPMKIGLFRVPYKKFTHYDFLLARDSKVLLYDQIIEILNKY